MFGVLLVFKSCLIIGDSILIWMGCFFKKGGGIGGRVGKGFGIVLK